jgi:hypothetical protein
MITTQISPLQRLVLLLGAGFLLALTGCNGTSSGGYVSAGTTGEYLGDDEYVYYPDYEVYYARNRHQYMYRDGRSWVTRPAPAGISVDVLLASPSVRMDFHDRPDRHHAEIVREYPRHAAPPSPGYRTVYAGPDNYVYYPGQEVYFNTTRRQYVYRDGSNWVTRPEPPRHVAPVLPASPAVPVDFHDAPERHHSEVVRHYPKNWTPAPKRPDDNDHRKDARKDDHQDDRQRQN